MTSSIVSLLSITGRMLSSYHPGDAFPFGNATPHDPSFPPPPDDFVPFSPAPTEKFIKKDHDNDGLVKVDDFEEVSKFKSEAAAKASESGTENATANMTDAEIRDKIKQKKWTEPDADGPSPEARAKFIKTVSFGAVDINDQGAVRNFLHFLSGVNWFKVALFWFVIYCIWVFLLVLSLMGTGFKLLGGRDSAKMFDIADNPISALMIGILATVLVQSSSTTTSIIVSLVGANELSVRVAVFMIMGANIGTSVTNTIVAMGHFANQDDLRRGFSAATVHDCFNLLCVLVFLPLNWIYPFFEKMTYEMVKDMEECDDNCNKREFLKPYVSPYVKGVAKYDKNVAKYISQNYCAGLCEYSFSSDAMGEISKMVCADDGNGGNDCSGTHANYDGAWMSSGKLYKKRAPAFFKTGTATGERAGAGGYYLSCPAGENCDNAIDVYNATSSTFLVEASQLQASTLYRVCPEDEMKNNLCDKSLLKGGLAYDEWDMTEEGAGSLLTILAVIGLCCCLFCIVYCLQIIIKGTAARILKQVVGFNPYLNIIVGMGITILVQSSSITTSTLTPIAAVGLISLEEMFPLTLGANIGTTLSGVMAATVVTSNVVNAWQVSLCHFFFNVFGILVWYPIPKVRQIPLNMCRFLGRMTANETYGKVFPLIYTFTMFFIIPGIAYGIASAAAA